jgi:hypothetical protein
LLASLTDRHLGDLGVLDERRRDADLGRRRDAVACTTPRSRMTAAAAPARSAKGSVVRIRIRRSALRLP